MYMNNGTTFSSMQQITAELAPLQPPSCVPLLVVLVVLGEGGRAQRWGSAGLLAGTEASPRAGWAPPGAATRRLHLTAWSAAV